MHLQPAWHRPRLSASVLLRSPVSQLQARRQHHALSRPLTCPVAAAAAEQVQKRSRSSGDDEDGQNEFADYKVLCYSAQKYVLDTMEDTFRETFPNISFVEAQLDKDTTALAKDADAVILFVNDDCSTEVAEVLHEQGVRFVAIIQAQLDKDTTALAKDADAVILFVNDDCSIEVAEALHEQGVRFVAMRRVGFDKVDIGKLNELGIKVARVPTYSPESVAEHSVTLALALNRNIVRAHNRVMQGNYTLSGLIGMELCRKTVGIIGTSAIGACAARIWRGFGCRVIACDIKKNPELEEKGLVEYLDMDEVLQSSDILSLHCPLMSKNFHMIDKDGIEKMKQDAMLINCSRGGLVDTAALVDALESGKIGGAAMDVYEGESGLLFKDFSQYTHKDRQKMNAFDRWDLKPCLIGIHDT